jgi:hypothetical protein
MAGAKPPAHSYSCSAFETEAIVSMIMASRFPDDRRIAESSSTITIVSSSLGPVLVGVTRAAQEAGVLMAVSPSTTVVTGTGGSGAIDASSVAAAAGTSSA